AGLCTVLLPLGLAASLVGRLFIEQRQLTILLSGLVLIGLGAYQALGGGFHVAPPGLEAMSRTTATYATGLVYGLTGFCSGPLLGGVLPLAAAGQSPALGIGLLLVYALGMVLPLFVLALAWDRLSVGHKAFLRGTGLKFAGLRLHSTNVVAGTLF